MSFFQVESGGKWKTYVPGGGVIDYFAYELIELIEVIV